MDEYDRHPLNLKAINSERPERVPTRPMGDPPVLARLVLEGGGERWQVARANRWTATHVLVTWQNDPSDPHSSQLCWLRADDVVRSLSGEGEDMELLWGRLRG